ncbi:MAG: carboxypeptidase-like regulatory domain-containing protein [Bacteroidaceae bacterium]|nr:carboxypeptidase-like regulatory domain-containing protein [Bacteroidaceae bacterium]
MRRIQLFLSFVLLSVSIWAQELMVQGRVVDAKTGEALPYVSIYVSEGKGTLSNNNGEFKLTADANDILKFSCIGYEKISFKANELPPVIRLKPYTTILGEVTIQALRNEDMLKLVIANLKQDYKKQGKMARKYFFRTLTEKDEGTYIAEAFMMARSVVNIRSAMMISGLQNQDTEDNENALNFSFSNIHKLLEVAPMTYNSRFWYDVLKPLESFSTLRKYYETHIQQIQGEDGKNLYRIEFSLKENISEEKKHSRNITGTAYVDADTYRLLRFDGSCNNFRVGYGWFIRFDTTIKFHLEYDYSQGAASVSHVAIQGGTEVSRYRALLFAIGPDKEIAEKMQSSDINMVSALRDAGYDSTLWAKYDIVKRTEKEEAVAFGISIDSSLHKKKKPAYPKAFQPLIERLDAFGKAIPQEKVYVHMDNTCYFQGDTIWFTAYLKETASGKPSDISGVLYVELLNNDGYLVERKLIEMKEGRGNGFFALNHQIQYSGFYELRAYTRWQLNWGIFEHDHSYVNNFMFVDKESEEEYYRDYEKLYSRVFPVYDKPAVPGDYTREMTLRVLRRTFKTDMDEKERKPLLTLFPEGGNLVAGVENRVAFEAAMSDGEQLVGTLVFGNDSVKTVNRGRGVFTVVPEKGMEREVTFTSSTGKTVTAKLPKPEEEGVAVQISQEGDSAIITMNLAGLDPDSLALTVMCEGMLEDYKVLSEGLCMKIGGLKPGVHQATVFDTQGRVFADRLFFVTKPDLAKPTLAVSGLQNKNLPYQPINLSLKASPASGGMKGALLSVAVRDESQADALFDNGNIMTEMLLSSEVKGFIPNPGWFFEKDDEEHRQALDLLMMTQGWRRFVWRHMAVKKTWDLTQPEERQPIIKGYVRVNPYRKSLPSTDDGMLGYIPDSVFFKKEEPGSITKPFSNNKEEPALLKKANQEVKSVDYKPLLALSQKNASGNLIVHAELADADGSNQVVAGEYQLKDGMFKFLCPKYYDNSVFFLSVADEKRLNNKKKKYQWVQMALMEDISPKLMRKLDLDEADYRAYVTWPYPRFVKPYGFYQSHMPQNNKASENGIPLELLDDTVKTMQELEVTAKRRNRLKRFNDAYPAFSVDAYEAWNTIEDAGVPLFNYVNISRAMVRVYMNNYGLPEPPMGEDSRIQLQYGLSPTRRSLPQYIDIPTDSLYHPKYLTSVAKGFDFSPGERREYFGDERVNEDPRFLIDRFVVYTDYQPRHEGSQRYAGANRPETRVAVYPIYEWNRRPIYRDRRYILPGFASPAEFYSPDYSKQTPPEPKDYRRTLYWNPDLKLDENGEATITFFNNSRTTHLSIEAEGQAADGTLLWGKIE